MLTTYPPPACSAAGGPLFTAAAIEAFNDDYAEHFLRFGPGRGFGAIHRPVWAPGIASRERALHYVDDRIVDLLGTLSSANRRRRVVDLGCGIASSLRYLAGRLPIEGVGINLSPVQCRIANKRIAAAKLSDRLSCVQGDHCVPLGQVGAADLTFALESFSQATTPDQFLAQAARITRPGGLLVICDDFRRGNEGTASMIDRVMRGLRLNTLLDREELGAMAAAFGFTLTAAIELTPWLGSRSLNHRLLETLGRVIDRWWALEQIALGPLLASATLQACYARGWLGYDLLVFRRDGHS